MKDKLILGTVQFGLKYGVNNLSGKIDSRNIESILNAAYDRGVRLLDSAESYGTSHEEIGNYHLKSTNTFEVITKFSSTRKDLPGKIRDRVLMNLNLLQVDQLYGYMFHSFEDYIKFYKDFEKDLITLKEGGFIQKLGVSIYTNEELKEVMKNPKIELVQLPFNLFDNSLKREKILKEAKLRGLEINVRSTFLQGLFFKSITTIDGKLSPLKPYLVHLEEIKKNYSLTTEALALQYSLQKNYIDKVLIGVDNLEHLIENIDTCSKYIDIPNHVIDSINIEENHLLNPINWI